MKKTIGTMGVIALTLLFASANAQEPQKWDPKNNRTVDSIVSPYTAKILPARPVLATADIFPAIGKYESTTNHDASVITITIDPDNKGMIWVEGLPQGRVKAMLQRSPATYKIPAQKTEDGKEVAEGTLLYDKEANTLHIAIGKAYDSKDPSTAFSVTAEEPVVVEEKVKGNKKKIKVETKPKAWMYSGSKVETSTVSSTPANQ